MTTFTKLPMGIVLIEPAIHGDKRGFFFEACNREIEEELGVSFVQDNQAFRVKNTVVGLHGQKAPFEQGKLVRVLHGKIKDVVVDVRPDSDTYGKTFEIILTQPTALGYKMLYIPAGLYHGFSVLSDYADVLYKCTNVYSKEHETGISPLSYKKWGVKEHDMIVSDKDKAMPELPL